MRFKDFFKFLVKLIISTSLIVYILKKIDLSQLPILLKEANYNWILIGVSAIVISNFLGALQWHTILKETEINISYKKSLKFYHTGLFFNNFLLSFIGGDVVRIYDISKTSGKNSSAFSTVFFDRLVGLFTLSVFALIFACFSGELMKSKIILVSTLGFFIILAFFIMFFFFKRFAKKFQNLGEKILPKMFHQGAHDMYNNIYHFKKKKTVILKIFCISLGVQILRIMVHYFAALSLGVSVKFTYFFVMIPIILIVITIPISIGGIGVREQTAIILFGKVGITGPQAFTIEVIAYLIGIISSLPGGFMFLISKERKEKLAEAKI